MRLGRRVEQLDFARAVAMLSVILIHVTSAYVGSESRWTAFGVNPAFFLNQAARFAVPLFILLSGISLGLGAAPGRAGDFYRGRLRKIGAAYLLWFAVYFAYNRDFHVGAVAVGPLVRSLLLGREASHLYFVVLIFQLYLLFPYLKGAVGRAPWRSVLFSFAITYFVQQAFSLRRFHVELIPACLRPYLWMLFPTWLFYFVLGLALAGFGLPRLERFCTQNALPVLGVTAALALLYVVESRATGTLDSIKVSLLPYTLLALFSAYALWGYWGRYRVVRRTTAFLARHSMTVYFGHVLILGLLRRFPVFYRGMGGMALLYIAVAAASLLAAGAIDGLAALACSAGRALLSAWRRFSGAG